MVDEKNVDLANAEISDDDMADVAGGLYEGVDPNTGARKKYFFKKNMLKAQDEWEAKKKEAMAINSDLVEGDKKKKSPDPVDHMAASLFYIQPANSDLRKFNSKNPNLAGKTKKK